MILSRRSKVETIDLLETINQQPIRYDFLISKCSGMTYTSDIFAAVKETQIAQPAQR
jgi:hypothetical protein